MSRPPALLFTHPAPHMALRDWLRNLFRPKPPAPPVPPPVPPVPPVPPAPPGDGLALHNAERTPRNRPPFTTDPRLTAAAQRHAEWMARTGRLTHGGEGQVWDRVSEAGYRWTWVGENIAETGDPVYAMKLWMDSPGHRDNILTTKATQMGFGVAGGYCCAVFARPA